MWYRTRRKVKFSYTIEKRKYEYSIDPAFAIKVNESKTFKVKATRHRSLSVRSLWHKDSKMIVCPIAGEEIPLNDKAYEKFLDHVNKMDIVESGN